MLWEGSRKVNIGIFEPWLTGKDLPSGEQDDKKVVAKKKVEKK